MNEYMAKYMTTNNRFKIFQIKLVIWINIPPPPLQIGLVLAVCFKPEATEGRERSTPWKNPSKYALTTFALH